MVTPNDPPLGAPGVARPPGAEPDEACASLRLGTKEPITIMVARMVLPIVVPRSSMQKAARRTYFSRSATFANPAFAQASSVSWLDPELPTPPMVSPPT
jgi:hypothetical protein